MTEHADTLPRHGRADAPVRRRSRRAAPARAVEEVPQTEPVDLRIPAKGTLARRLILRVALITGALAVFLGLITTVVAQGVLIGQVDRRLDAELIRQDPTSTDPGGLPLGADLPGQPIGTVVVFVYPSPDPSQDPSEDTAAHAYLTPDGLRGVPSNAALNSLYQVQPDAGPVSVELQMLGWYRVASTMVGGTEVIVGLPLTETRAVIVKLVWTFGAITVLATVIGVLSVYLVVVRSLQPMTDLATAAREVSATPLEHGHVDLSRAPNPPPGRSAEIRDVSDAFNQMLGHVEGALQARQLSESRVRTFVADVSHELRNPLAAIRGYAELTRRDRDAMPAQSARALDRIDAEAERMSALVEDLLLLARLDNDPTPANDPVDLSQVVVDATADAQVAGPGHCWSLDVPPEPVILCGDRHQVHQVVANLLANARTHTPPGTAVHTRLTVDRDKDTGQETAVVMVHDNGPGIPAAMVDKVFDRFVRVDTARARIPDASTRVGSTGLGLSIVAAVVEAHGGTVEVASRCAADLPPDQSEASTWTTFTVRLPIVPEATGRQADDC